MGRDHSSSKEVLRCHYIQTWTVVGSMPRSMNPQKIAETRKEEEVWYEHVGSQAREGPGSKTWNQLTTFAVNTSDLWSSVQGMLGDSKTLIPTCACLVEMLGTCLGGGRSVRWRAAASMYDRGYVESGLGCD